MTSERISSNTESQQTVKNSENISISGVSKFHEEEQDEEDNLKFLESSSENEE